VDRVVLVRAAAVQSELALHTAVRVLAHRPAA